MGWLGDLAAGGIEGILGGAKDLIGEFHLSPEKEREFQMAFSAVVNDGMNKLMDAIKTTLGAKERVLVAELQQGDKFTKRARPSVVYVGLVFIGINYVLFPVIGWFISLIAYIKGVTLPTLPALNLPAEFWVAWGGITGTWAIGRTVEKAKVGGIVGQLAGVITGSKSPTLLD